MILLAPHIAAFLQQRLPIERRASPNTCDSYAHAFRLLFEYASHCLKLPPSQLQLEQLDAPLIVNFLNHLETTRGNGAGSRNIRLAAIKSFMHYMEYRVPSALEQIQRVLAIPAKKADTRLVRHLTAQEMQSILDAPDPTIRNGIRDRAMLHLCFAGGLRVSELVGLRIEDMMLQPQASVLIHGKGRKERCLPLWKETASAVRAWLSVRGEVRVPELFPNARNDVMTRAGFEYILRKHVHTAETRCPTLSSKRCFSACAKAHLCPDHSASYQGSPEGVSLARAFQHANDRDLHSRRPERKARSFGIGDRSEAANRPLQGNGQADRPAEDFRYYAE